VEAAILGLARELEAEIVAVLEAGQARPKQGLGGVVRWIAGRGSRRDRGGSQGVLEALGKIRAWIDGRRLVGHSQEDGSLGLAPGGVMDPGTGAGFARLDSAAVDHHRGQRNRRFGLLVRRGQSPGPEGLGRLTLLRHEFVADLAGEVLEMPGGDDQACVDLKQLRRVLERSGRDRRGDRLGQRRRTVLAMVESLPDSVGGKRLAGSASRSKKLPGAGSARPE
jgi:hypothetical protein